MVHVITPGAPGTARVSRRARQHTRHRRVRRVRLLTIGVMTAISMSACTPANNATTSPSPSATIASPTASVTPSDSPSASPTPSSREAGGDVGVDFFQWPWDSVATQCADVLGPLGVGWIVVSSPLEHVVGAGWDVTNEPVSYQFSSRFGDPESFAKMIETCQGAGVAVWVTTILNNMAAAAPAESVGFAGTPYSHTEYIGLYEPTDFHSCGTTRDAIVDPTSVFQTRTCDVEGRADLKTEDPGVRQILATHLDDLAALGVAGVVIESATNIAPQDLAAISALQQAPLPVLQRVGRTDGLAITPEDYLETGSVVEPSWTTALTAALGTDAPLSDYASFARGTGSEFVPSDDAVIAAATATSQRDHSSLTYRDGNAYVDALALTLASPYGHPLVLSDYTYLNPAAGPPLESADAEAPGTVIAPECPSDLDELATAGAALMRAADHSATGTWLCQQTWPIVTGMVGWRATAGDSAIRVTTPLSDVLAIERADAFLAVADPAGDGAQLTVNTGLPAGEYCNVAQGAPSTDGTCAGGAVTVEAGGSASLTLRAGGVVALHTGAQVPVDGETPTPSPSASADQG